MGGMDTQRRGTQINCHLSRLPWRLMFHVRTASATIAYDAVVMQCLLLSSDRVVAYDDLEIAREKER